MNKFKFRNREIIFDGSSLLVGILNVTPDSFSDGGQYNNTRNAVKHALEMLNKGATIIDIGGESTRPGAKPVSDEEESSRIIPVIRELKTINPDIIISVDTTKSSVAKTAIESGADIINDASGLQNSRDMAQVVASAHAGLVIMHTRGNPANMMGLTDYKNLLDEVIAFLLCASGSAMSAGVSRDSIIVDPGIGFAKNLKQNLEIIRNTDRFRGLGFPLMIGPSRKSFIGSVIGEEIPRKRVWGTAGVVAWLAMKRTEFIRVHDVGEMSDVLKIIKALAFSNE